MAREGATHSTLKPPCQTQTNQIPGEKPLLQRNEDEGEVQARPRANTNAKERLESQNGAARKLYLQEKNENQNRGTRKQGKLNTGETKQRQATSLFAGKTKRKEKGTNGWPSRKDGATATQE